MYCWYNANCIFWHGQLQIATKQSNKRLIWTNERIKEEKYKYTANDEHSILIQQVSLLKRSTDFLTAFCCVAHTQLFLLKSDTLTGNVLDQSGLWEIRFFFFDHYSKLKLTLMMAKWNVINFGVRGKSKCFKVFFFCIHWICHAFVRTAIV